MRYKLNEQLFATVNAAVAAVGVGGKVHLLPGEYTEEINLDKSVTLTSGLASKNPVEDDADFKDATKAAVIKGLILTSKANTTIEGLTFEQHSSYVQNMISSTLNYYGAIVAAFEPHLRNWKWDRLPLLTRAVLLMSYAHFYYVEKIDKRIVINTAVELAKKYIEDKQAKFINAILDEVL